MNVAQIYNFIKQKYYVINVGKELSYPKVLTFKFSRETNSYHVLKYDFYGFYEFIRYTSGDEVVAKTVIEKGYNPEKLYLAINREENVYA